MHVLVADTADALVARTLELVEDPELGERLATAAFDRVRAAYTWDRSAAVLAAHLRRVAEGG